MFSNLEFNSLQKVNVTKAGEYFLSQVNSNEVLKELKKKGYIVSGFRLSKDQHLSSFKVTIEFANGYGSLEFSFYYSSDAGALVLAIKEGNGFQGIQGREFLKTTTIRGFDYNDFKQYGLL